MAKWWQVGPLSPKESTVSPPQSGAMVQMQEQVADHLMALTEELNRYKEHGTSDPVLIAQARVLAEALRNRGSIEQYQVAAAYGAVYMKVADTRRKLIKEVDKMRFFYLVDVILTQFTEDALAPEIGTGNIVKVSSQREELQREIDLLEEKFDFDQLVAAICPDVCAYGEYTLKTTVKPKGAPTPQEGKVTEEVVQLVSKDGKPVGQEDDDTVQRRAPAQDDGTGLVEINDIVEQGTVVALTQYSDTLGYLSVDQDGKIHKHEAADFVKFSLSSQRIRIDLHKEFNIQRGGSSNKPQADALKDIPRYIRVGKSVIYPVIAKLKELELLEALVPATKLAKLASGTVVGVQVPSGYDINKAMEASRHVEQILNKKVGVDARLGELTIENIMNTAGRMKVVPIFGDKGQLSKLDYQSNEPEDLLASVNQIRDTICSSVGYPSELLFSTDGNQKKADILKKYARYLRKLKQIQKAMEEGIRQLIYIHLVNKGYKFSNEDIKVEFYNKLIEIDNLDKLEFVDTTVGLLKNAKDFFFELADPATNPHFADRVDVEEFLDFLNMQLNVVGFNNLIQVKHKQDKAKHAVSQKNYTEHPDQAAPTVGNGGASAQRAGESKLDH